MSLYFYTTALGKLGIAEQDGNITHLYFENDIIPNNLQIMETPLLIEASLQLKAFLNGVLKEFSLPLKPQGTVFMQQVWHSVCQVPYGKTASYKDIALAINNPKAVRAVGRANWKNPVPLFIPCHRIIGSNGKLIGYNGGLELKTRLLALELQHAAF